MTALVFKNKEGKPLSLMLTAALVGYIMGIFGYEADLVEVPQQVAEEEQQSEAA